MISKIIATLLSLIVCSSAAQALTMNKFHYTEYCIPAGSCVIHRISLETGTYIFQLREGQVYPRFGRSLSPGGVLKDQVYDEYIGAISDSDYQKLKASGLESYLIDPENIREELEKAEFEIHERLMDCVWDTAICLSAGVAALKCGT